jgi:predicted transcriptional regulator of viral defense system
VSLRKDAYISHGSAAYLHNLTDDEPNTTFVNKEQTPKPTYGSLTQEALTKAFSRKQRESNYVFKYGKASITLLSGKHTNNLGVEGKEGRMGEHVNVTGIERTLIDITVRPGYAGGVAQVLQCFAKAVGRASGEKLIRLLKKMDYLYPYHQAIGFYMQKAGFERSCWLPLQSDTLTYDFFLAHGIKQEKYVREWRLFVPANF